MGFIDPDQAEALPLLAVLLLVVVLALMVVVIRQRRVLRRLGQSSPQPSEIRPSAATPFEAGIPASRGSLVPTWLTLSIADAREAMTRLAASPDFVSFDRSFGLGTALADLELAARSAASTPMVDELREGLQQAGWLHRIFRCELALESLAAPGSAWAGLGRALATIGSATRAELARAGVEVVRPNLLTPVQRGHEVADEGLSDLRHIAIFNRAIRTAIAAVPEPAILVVDCLRCGIRETEPGSSIPRVSPALVVLYAPMLWRAAAQS